MYSNEGLLTDSQLGHFAWWAAITDRSVDQYDGWNSGYTLEWIFYFMLAVN